MASITTFLRIFAPLLGLWLLLTVQSAQCNPCSSNVTAGTVSTGLPSTQIALYRTCQLDSDSSCFQLLTLDCSGSVATSSHNCTCANATAVDLPCLSPDLRLPLPTQLISQSFLQATPQLVPSVVAVESADSTTFPIATSSDDVAPKAISLARRPLLQQSLSSTQFSDKPRRQIARVEAIALADSIFVDAPNVRVVAAAYDATGSSLVISGSTLALVVARATVPADTRSETCHVGVAPCVFSLGLPTAWFSPSAAVPLLLAFTSPSASAAAPLAVTGLTAMPSLHATVTYSPPIADIAVYWSLPLAPLAPGDTFTTSVFASVLPRTLKAWQVTLTYDSSSVTAHDDTQGSTIAIGFSGLIKVSSLGTLGLNGLTTDTVTTSGTAVPLATVRFTVRSSVVTASTALFGCGGIQLSDGNAEFGDASTPCTFDDATGRSSQGSVSFRTNDLRGILLMRAPTSTSETPSNNLVNTAMLTGESLTRDLHTYAVYSSASTPVTLVTPTACSALHNNMFSVTSRTGGCQVQLTGGEVVPSPVAATEVVATLDSKQTSMVFSPWSFASLRVVLDRSTLQSIQHYPADCQSTASNANRFQSTGAHVLATLQNADGSVQAGTVDVTGLVSLTADNNAVASVRTESIPSSSTSSVIIEGLTTGTTPISALRPSDQTPLASTLLTVSTSAPVTIVSLHVAAATGLLTSSSGATPLTTFDAAGMPGATINVTGVVQSLEVPGAEAEIIVWLLLSDGTVQEVTRVTPGSLLVHANLTEGAVRVVDAVDLAGMPTYRALAMFDWCREGLEGIFSTCSENSVAFQAGLATLLRTSATVVVKFPKIASVTLSVTEPRLAISASDPLALLGLSTSSSLFVLVIFETGLQATFSTSDSTSITSSDPSRLVVTAQPSATPTGASSGTLTLVATVKLPGQHAVASDPVTISVVATDSFTVGVHQYPPDVNSGAVNLWPSDMVDLGDDDVGRLGCALAPFQQRSLSLKLVASDGASQPVTQHTIFTATNGIISAPESRYYSATSGVVVVTPESPGTVTVSANFGLNGNGVDATESFGALNSPVSVTLMVTYFQSPTEMGFTLVGQSGVATAQTYVDLVLADGTRVTAASARSDIPLAYSSSNSSIASVDSATGLVTLRLNSVGSSPVEIMAKLSCSSSTSDTAAVSCNLAPVMGDVDLGPLVSFPFAQMAPGVQFDIEVRVNVGSIPLGFFLADVYYDKTRLELLGSQRDSRSDWSEILVTPDAVCVGCVRVLGLVKSTGLLTNVVSVVTLTFRARAGTSGTASFSGSLVELNNRAGNTLIASVSYPRTFQAGTGAMVVSASLGRRRRRDDGIEEEDVEEDLARIFSSIQLPPGSADLDSALTANHEVSRVTRATACMVTPVRGDVNCDAQVTGTDAQLLQLFLVHQCQNSLTSPCVAAPGVVLDLDVLDVDHNQLLQINDVSRLNRAISAATYIAEFEAPIQVGPSFQLSASLADTPTPASSVTADVYFHLKPVTGTLTATACQGTMVSSNEVVLATQSGATFSARASLVVSEATTIQVAVVVVRYDAGGLTSAATTVTYLNTDWDGPNNYVLQLNDNVPGSYAPVMSGEFSPLPIFTACPSGCATCCGTQGLSAIVPGFYLDATTGTCPACISCSFGITFEVSPCTATAQRQCQACTTCISGVSFATQNCSLSVDTVCQSCSTCPSTSFVSRACTLFYDTGCTPLRVCNATEFEMVSPTPTNDRVCAACPSADCPAGLFQSGLCGNGLLTLQCSPCPPNTFKGIASAATLCTPCTSTMCGAGFTLSAACSATQNQICLPCTTGTFKPLVGNVACAACTQACDAGTELTGSCTSITSPSCPVCPPQHYSLTRSALPCSPCTASCPSVAETLVGDCTATSTPVCTPCDSTCATCARNSPSTCLTCVGSFLLEGSSCVSACTTGNYQDASGSACLPCNPACAACFGPDSNNCVACVDPTFLLSASQTCVSTCPSDYYKVVSPTRECRPCTLCGANQFASGGCLSSGFADRNCANCTSACPPGQELLGICGASTDDQCVACPQGSFKAVNGGEACEPCETSCALGEFLNGTCADGIQSTSCDPCSICSPSTFALAGCHGSFDTICQICTLCSAGFHQSAPCLSSTDRVCAACPSGSFAPLPNSDALCTPCQLGCPSGTFESQACTATEDRTCTACEPGCVTCTSARVCVECNASQNLTLFEDRCVRFCHAGFYANAQTGTCEPCSTCGQGESLVSECNALFDTQCANCTLLVAAGQTCTCPTGFIGTHCDIVQTFCRPLTLQATLDYWDQHGVIPLQSQLLLPCANGGNCTDHLGGYSCACSCGFTGATCDASVDVCSSNPCANGGVCTANTVDACTFACTCAAGWTGTLCDVDFDECLSNPCAHGGTCLDGLSSFECVCAQGFVNTLCLERIRCGVAPNIANATVTPAGTELVFGDTAVYVCDGGFTTNGFLNGTNFFVRTCNSQGLLTNPLSCTPIGTVPDPCAGAPCASGSTCALIGASFVCLCPQGYTGTLCSVEIDHCDPNPCQHRGSCVDLGLVPKCTCTAGYTGSRCETEVDFCGSSPCGVGATCILRPALASFVCACPEGFEGPTCQDDVDVCRTVPCSITGAINCTDGVALAFACTCREGYRGVRCDEDIDGCDAHNITCVQGSCTDMAGSDLSRFGNPWRCDCPLGVYGALCEVNTTACAINPCQNCGSCLDIPIESPTDPRYRCECVGGFHGDLCEIGDPCFNGGLLNDTSCDFCSCPPEYTGTFCETLLVRNSSCYNYIKTSFANQEPLSPCLNNGTCLDIAPSGGIAASAHCVAFNGSCACAAGFTGPCCEINIDECAPATIAQAVSYGVNPLAALLLFGGALNDTESDLMCPLPWMRPTTFNSSLPIDGACLKGGICIDAIARFVCDCPAGLTGPSCECELQECASNPCANDGTCSDLFNGFTCACAAGWTGSVCDMDINECVETPSVCVSNANCTNLVGAYTCECHSGYFGDARTLCAACTPLHSCPAGFEDHLACNATHDRTCRDIDACRTSPCFTNCTDRAAPDLGFDCAPCPPGQWGDGLNCTVCHECEVHEYIERGCNSTHNTICNDCMTAAQCTIGATFLDAPCTGLTLNATATCVPCSVGCPHGHYQSQPCTTLADRQCTRCTNCQDSLRFEVSKCTPEANTLCLLACPVDTRPNLVNYTCEPCAALCNNEGCVPTNSSYTTTGSIQAPTSEQDGCCVACPTGTKCQHIRSAVGDPSLFACQTIVSTVSDPAASFPWIYLAAGLAGLLLVLLLGCCCVLCARRRSRRRHRHKQGHERLNSLQMSVFSDSSDSFNGEDPAPLILNPSYLDEGTVSVFVAEPKAAKPEPPGPSNPKAAPEAQPPLAKVPEEVPIPPVPVVPRALEVFGSARNANTVDHDHEILSRLESDERNFRLQAEFDRHEALPPVRCARSPIVLTNAAHVQLAMPESDVIRYEFRVVPGNMVKKDMVKWRPDPSSCAIIADSQGTWVPVQPGTAYTVVARRLVTRDESGGAESVKAAGSYTIIDWFTTPPRGVETSHETVEALVETDVLHVDPPVEITPLDRSMVVRVTERSLSWADETGQRAGSVMPQMCIVRRQVNIGINRGMDEWIEPVAHNRDESGLPDERPVRDDTIVCLANVPENTKYTLRVRAVLSMRFRDTHGNPTGTEMTMAGPWSDPRFTMTTKEPQYHRELWRTLLTRSLGDEARQVIVGGGDAPHLLDIANVLDSSASVSCHEARLEPLLMAERAGVSQRYYQMVATTGKAGNADDSKTVVARVKERDVARLRELVIEGLQANTEHRLFARLVVETDQQVVLAGPWSAPVSVTTCASNECNTTLNVIQVSTLKGKNSGGIHLRSDPDGIHHRADVPGKVVIHVKPEASTTSTTLYAFEPRDLPDGQEEGKASAVRMAEEDSGVSRREVRGKEEVDVLPGYETVVQVQVKAQKGPPKNHFIHLYALSDDADVACVVGHCTRTRGLEASTTVKSMDGVIRVQTRKWTMVDLRPQTHPRAKCSAWHVALDIERSAKQAAMKTMRRGGTFGRRKLQADARKAGASADVDGEEVTMPLRVHPGMFLSLAITVTPEDPSEPPKRHFLYVIGKFRPQMPSATMRRERSLALRWVAPEGFDTTKTTVLFRLEAADDEEDGDDDEWATHPMLTTRGRANSDGIADDDDDDEEDEEDEEDEAALEAYEDDANAPLKSKGLPVEEGSREYRAAFGDLKPCKRYDVWVEVVFKAVRRLAPQRSNVSTLSTRFPLSPPGPVQQFLVSRNESHFVYGALEGFSVSWRPRVVSGQNVRVLGYRIEYTEETEAVRRLSAAERQVELLSDYNEAEHGSSRTVHWKVVHAHVPVPAAYQKAVGEWACTEQRRTVDRDGAAALERNRDSIVMELPGGLMLGRGKRWLVRIQTLYVGGDACLDDELSHPIRSEVASHAFGGASKSDDTLKVVTAEGGLPGQALVTSHEVFSDGYTLHYEPDRSAASDVRAEGVQVYVKKIARLVYAVYEDEETGALSMELDGMLSRGEHVLVFSTRWEMEQKMAEAERNAQVFEWHGCRFMIVAEKATGSGGEGEKVTTVASERTGDDGTIVSTTVPSRLRLQLMGIPKRVGDGEEELPEKILARMINRAPDKVYTFAWRPREHVADAREPALMSCMPIRRVQDEGIFHCVQVAFSVAGRCGALSASLLVSHADALEQMPQELHRNLALQFVEVHSSLAFSVFKELKVLRSLAINAEKQLWLAYYTAIVAQRRSLLPGFHSSEVADVEASEVDAEATDLMWDEIAVDHACAQRRSELTSSRSYTHQIGVHIEAIQDAFNTKWVRRHKEYMELPHVHAARERLQAAEMEWRKLMSLLTREKAKLDREEAAERDYWRQRDPAIVVQEGNEQFESRRSKYGH